MTESEKSLYNMYWKIPNYDVVFFVLVDFVLVYLPFVEWANHLLLIGLYVCVVTNKLTPDYTEIHVHVFESYDTCMLTYVIIWLKDGCVCPWSAVLHNSCST